MQELNKMLIGRWPVMYDRWMAALPCEPQLVWKAHNLFAELVLRYSEEQRLYHTLQHISECIDVWDSIKSNVAQELRPLIELALFYHDVVYDPTRIDNEEQSAVLMRRHLAELGCESAFINDIASPILHTTHKGLSLGPDEEAARWVVDIDLSSLASRWDRFNANTKAIKFEYSHLLGFTDKQWREGRTKFYQSMLARRYIYYTDVCRTRFEQKARDNLAKGLELLNV